jgi:hypothetical protein
MTFGERICNNHVFIKASRKDAPNPATLSFAKFEDFFTVTAFAPTLAAAPQNSHIPARRFPIQCPNHFYIKSSQSPKLPVKAL